MKKYQILFLSCLLMAFYYSCDEEQIPEEYQEEYEQAMMEQEAGGGQQDNAPDRTGPGPEEEVQQSGGEEKKDDRAYCDDSLFCIGDPTQDDNQDQQPEPEDAPADTNGLHAAFAEFDSNNVTVYAQGDNVVIETNGLPNHTTPYWPDDHELHVEWTSDERMTPSRISEESDYSGTLTVSANPQLANSPSATGLGAIGIAVSGVYIYNDEEGNNVPLYNEAGTLDYVGAHIGPSVYHYHLEPVPISDDDSNLIGIMSDGFFIYGRKCNSTGSYPDDLDESGGHTHTTQHSEVDEYHYHMINEEYYDLNNYVLFGGDLQGTPGSMSSSAR